MSAPARAVPLPPPDTPCRKVVGQMQPPIIPRPTWLAETAGIDEQDMPPWADTQRGGDLGRGDQLAQDPQQPRATRAEALTPRSFGNICDPHQHRPGTQPARREGSQDISQYTPQEVVWGRKASHPLKGFESERLLGEVGRQTRHDFQCPGILHEG